MRVRRQKPATYEDLRALPENMVGELIDGELFASPRPAVPHAVAASQLMVEVGGRFGRDGSGPGGWWIIVEPELKLGEDVLVPDLAGWRRERFTPPAEAQVTVVPDWVCEIASPSTAWLDRSLKRERYARAGVRHLWLVNPLERLVEVFRLDAGLWRLLGTYVGDAKIRAEPFEAAEIDLSLLWIDATKPPQD